jgi:hypothetical protein
MDNVNYTNQVNILHSYIIGPVLIWTSYKMYNSASLNDLEKLLLLITGVIVVLYNGWRSVNEQLSGSSITLDSEFQMDLLHFLFIGPVIAWTGYKLYTNRMPTDLEKTTLLILGIISLSYVAYNKYKAQDE